MLGKNNTGNSFNISTFKKTKRKNFNAKEYLRKNVIRNGRAIIPIYIQSKDEMYNKHDLRGITLASDIRDYIDEVAYDIPYDYEITFEIQCEEELTEDDKIAMERVLKTYYGLEIQGVDVDLAISKRKSNGLFLISLISVIACAVSLKYFDGVFLELVFIALWYAIWEGVDIVLYDQQDLKYDRLDAVQLYDAKVEFADMNTIDKKAQIQNYNQELMQKNN